MLWIRIHIWNAGTDPNPWQPKYCPKKKKETRLLKGLSHEINFEKFDKNLQNLA